MLEGRGSKLCNETQDTAPECPATASLDVGNFKGGGWCRLRHWEGIKKRGNMGKQAIPVEACDRFGRGRGEFYFPTNLTQHVKPLEGR